MTLEHRIEPLHLLPGDPHRALLVAQELMEGPKMFNHARGLWGYSGTAADGELLTVQSTGMGGPSAAVVCEELIALGARRLVRIGTCGALSEGLDMGDLLAAELVLGADGASAALSGEEALRPDPVLLERLVAAGARPAMVVSSDLFYDPREGTARQWIEHGALAVEMEAAAVFGVAARRGVAAACVVGVTDVPAADGARRMTVEQREALGLRLGDAGYAAVRNR